MTTCSVQVNNLVATGDIWGQVYLMANTSQNIFISPNNNQIFLLEIREQETAGFTLNLQSFSSPTNIGVTISFFELRNNTVLSLGSVLVNELNTTFQKDFTPGFYVICIRTTFFTYIGNFTGNFASYQVYAILVPRAYTGEVSNPLDLEFHFERKKCTLPLQFELIDGSLPPGITFLSTSQSFGVLPNMDCVEDNEKLSPSQNWYSEHPIDFTWHPWGRQWNFQVKVWIVERPEISTTKWFCIRIKNNWSWDRDAFIIPTDLEEQFDVEIKPVPLPVDLCCEEEEEEIQFIPEVVPELCECDRQDSDEEKIVANFLEWYVNVIENEEEQNNPHIKEFIDNFRKTEYYRDIIRKAGLEHTLYTQDELEKKAFTLVIASYEKQLINNRRKEDIDYIMLDMQYKENQKLFTTPLGNCGEFCDIELTTYDFLYADLLLDYINISCGTYSYASISTIEQIIFGFVFGRTGETAEVILS